MFTPSVRQTSEDEASRSLGNTGSMRWVCSAVGGVFYVATQIGLLRRGVTHREHAMNRFDIRVRRLFFWCVGSARLVVWRAGPVINGVFNHRAHTRRRLVGRRHTAAGAVPNGRVDANRPRRQRNADPPGSRLPCRPGSRLEVHGAGLLAR